MMMKKYFLLLALLIGTSALYAQTVTTFVLVRHAEKASDGSKDPELAPEGVARAQALQQMLRLATVKAVYSTPYKRTQNTVAPLAAEKNLTIQFYQSIKAEQVDQMLKDYAGGTVVICGHSNTIPALANLLTGTDAYKDWKDGDYDNLLVISVVERGKATVTWLTYGAPAD
jgi:broad specificity phosphatase PhoE